MFSLDKYIPLSTDWGGGVGQKYMMIFTIHLAIHNLKVRNWRVCVQDFCNFSILQYFDNVLNQK